MGMRGRSNAMIPLRMEVAATRLLPKKDTGQSMQAAATMTTMP